MEDRFGHQFSPGRGPSMVKKLTLEISLVIIFLILLTRVPFTIACIAQGNGPGLGEMTRDQTILVGTPLELNCTLTSNFITYEGRSYTVDSSMLSIKFNKTYYPLSLLNHPDNRTLQLRIESATVQDNGMYFCYLKLPGLDHNATVCLSHVTVGYIPQPIPEEKFHCISWHFRNLTCRWDPPWNPIPTSYTLKDVMYYPFFPVPRDCGERPNATSCEWRADTKPLFRAEIRQFRFELTGENIFGKKTQVFEVDHFSIIKPEKPVEFAIDEASETSVSVLWQIPRTLRHEIEIVPHLVYQIRYRVNAPPLDSHGTINEPSSPSSSGPSSGSSSSALYSHSSNSLGFHSDEEEVVIDNIKGLNYTIRNLNPYLSYNISIRSKTRQAKSDEYWSDYAYLIVTTKADVPYRAPKFDSSSYEIIRVSDTSRNIKVRWIPVPHQYRNGPNFYYVIDVAPTIIDRRPQRSLLDFKYTSVNISDIDATNHEFDNLDVNTAYMFKIYAANERGVSRNVSVLTVNKSTLLPKKPFGLTALAYGSGRYDLMWNEPEEGSQNLRTYTIFWCPNLKPRPFPCEGPIQWRKIWANQTNFSIELPDSHTNYHFAVAADDEFSSSGMVWATCVVPIDGRLEKMIDFRTEVTKLASIDVYWKLDCPAQKQVVDGYEITYCEMSILENLCAERPRVKEVREPSAESATITGLEPNTKYRLTIRAITALGPNEESNPEYAWTKPDAPSDPPTHVEKVNVTENSIEIRWQPPRKPNGIIDKYVVHYDDDSDENYIDVDPKTNCVEKAYFVCSVNITQKVRSYTDYAVSVRACVERDLCSPSSSPLKIKTDIHYPSAMEAPWTEVVNESYIRILWKPPSAANGPIDHYLLNVESSNLEMTEYQVLGNSTEFLLPYTCLNGKNSDQSTEKIPQSVQIKAINIQNGKNLDGPFSKSSSTNVCVFTWKNKWLTIGISAGVASGLFIFVASLALLANCIKRRVAQIREIRIQLPIGLEGGKIARMEGFDSPRDGSHPDMRRADSTNDIHFESEGSSTLSVGAGESPLVSPTEYNQLNVRRDSSTRSSTDSSSNDANSPLTQGANRSASTFASSASPLISSSNSVAKNLHHSSPPPIPEQSSPSAFISSASPLISRANSGIKGAHSQDGRQSSRPNNGYVTMTEMQIRSATANSNPMPFERPIISSSYEPHDYADDHIDHIDLKPHSNYVHFVTMPM